MSAALKTLLFSTLYPSGVRPIHGIFVETRLRELLRSGRVQTRVVAPVPWFPSTNPRFGEYALMAGTPRSETRNGIQVEHPRYLLPPKVGERVAPYSLAAGALPTIRRLMAEGFDFDVIDAHFFYPDGVAAALIARKLGKPFVCTARGSDITLYRHHPHARRLLEQTVRATAGNIGVCADLVEQLIELGAPREKSHVMRNGVDLKRFGVQDKAASRARVGAPGDGLLLVSVGHLIERKGHHLVIGMLEHMPDARVAIVGSGEEKANLAALASQLGVTDRVIFAGQRPQEELKDWFNAADALVLASSREGWANVLLESMACGTPVVATNVNGTPEAVTSPIAGQMAQSRDVAGLLGALQRLLADYPDQASVRAYAEQFSWDATTQAQVDLFERIRAASR